MSEPRYNFRRRGITPQNIPPLPLELIHHILGYLEGDSATICACHCTCRQWYHVARPLVFKVARISNIYRAEELLKMLQSKPEMCHWVKELCFEYSSPKIVGQSSKHAGWVGRRGLAAFTKLAGNLPGVDTLSFRFITLNKEDHESSFIALAPLKHVRHMNFYRCRGHFTALVHLIKASPSLATVSIVESGFATMGEIQELNKVTLPRLSALSIIGCTYQQDEIRSWFRSAVKNEQWRSITIDVLHQYYMEETNRLLQDAGPHLRSLSIKFPDRGPNVWVPLYEFNTGGSVAHTSHISTPAPDPATRDVALENIDLGCNPNVRDLTLHNLDISEILPLLNRFVTLEIRTLSIRLSAVAVADTTVTAYRELDKRLEESDFDGFEEFRVLYEGTSQVSQVAKKMHQGFRAMSTLDILRIEQVPAPPPPK